MRTRRLDFWRRRLTKQIVKIYENQIKAMSLIFLLKCDLGAAGTIQTDIKHKITFRRNFLSRNLVREKNRSMTRTVNPDERKRIHSVRMKKVVGAKKTTPSRRLWVYFAWSD